MGGSSSPVEAAIEVAVLVVIALPFIRLAACRPFIRRLGGAPEQAAISIAAVATYAVVIGFAVAMEPTALRPLAAGGVIVAGGLWWRSRPNFGRSRGLPPGNLRVAPLAAWLDPDYFAKDAARYGPIFKTTTLFAPVVCVVGLPAAMELFGQHDAALAPPANRFGRFIPRGFIRSMSEEDHAIYAPILRSAVAGTVTRSAEPQLRSLIRATLVAAAGDHPPPAKALARSMVFPAFYRLFFGIKPNDPRVPRFNQLYDVLDPLHAWRHTPRGIRRAVDEVADLVDSQPIPDDCFLAAARRAHPEAADDPTLIKNLVYMLQTSGNDVSGLMAWVMWMVGRDQQSLNGVREAPQEEKVHAAKRIVMETVRLVQSEFIIRRATRTFVWRGLVIRRGTRVRVCVRESHRDPAIFADADSFQPDRWRDMNVKHDQYSPFGTAASNSRCLGEGLTLTFGRLFVEELATGYDLSVAEDGPQEFSGVHWRPNSRYRLRLDPRREPLTA